MPISRPPWISARSAGASVSIVSRSLSSAGRPASSSDDVAVGGGDRQLRPDRRGALRDAGQDLDAVEAHADRAVVEHLVAAEQDRRVVEPAAGGEAAEHRHRRRPPGQRIAAPARPGTSSGRRAGSRRPRPRGPASRPARRRPPRAPRSRRGTCVASPPSSAAAHTLTAVPCSTSRTPPITPPAPQPTSSTGASSSWMPSSVASGAARCAPDAKTTATSHARPPSASAASAAARRRSLARIRRGRESGADADAHRTDDSRPGAVPGDTARPWRAAP